VEWAVADPALGARCGCGGEGGCGGRVGGRPYIGRVRGGGLWAGAG
jgi:hypothetical protein